MSAGWMFLGTKRFLILKSSAGNGWVCRARAATACGDSHMGRGTVAGWLTGNKDWVRDESPLFYLGHPQS